MDKEPKQTSDQSITIDYQTIRDLALFQEQYDRLSDEIQQVKVQLDSSPSLEPGSPRAPQREEWRAWLQLQIKSKQNTRESLIKAILEKGVVVNNLPE